MTETTHVGPIVFADETARGQLTEYGECVTFRTDDRTTGRRDGHAGLSLKSV